MAELYSKEELGKQVVSAVMREIENWANQELKYIGYKFKSPLCLPIGKNTWLVGRHRIVRNKKKQYLLYSDTNLINKFSIKQAAFLYASMDKLEKYELGIRILNSDRLYGFLNEELEMLTLKKTKYKRSSNSFKIALIDAKLSDTQRKLIAAKKDLEKNLIQAKYVKVWD